jgi:DNA polymerase-3 subunit beta
MRILTVFKDDAESPKEVDVHLSDNQILFSYGSVELISRTIEGKYPDYRQLIPDSYKTEVRLTKEELQRAVKATSLFSRTGLNDITLSSKADGTVNVRANNSQTGEHSVDLDGAVVGSDNVITVNYKYLLDGVNNI